MIKINKNERLNSYKNNFLNSPNLFDDTNFDILGTFEIKKVEEIKDSIPKNDDDNPTCPALIGLRK
jgi:hypothetical protein